MQKYLFVLISAAMLLTACSGAGTEAVETGLEVYQVTVTKAKRGENSEQCS